MNLQGREFGICQSLKQSLEVLLSMLCMLWHKSSKRLFYIYQTLSEKVTIFRVDGRLQSRSNNAQIYVRDPGNTENYCEKDRTRTSIDLSLNLLFHFFTDDPIPEMCPFVTPRQT